MISYIKGELAAVGEEQVVVEVQGIGYGIFMPGQAMTMLPPIGSEVKIHTYLNVREDAMQLFGFLTKDDLKVFRLLIGVNGIGPKGGLNILSKMTPDDLRFAVLAGGVKKKFPLPAVLFDIGTATTASVIDKNGAHLGGAIMCGVKTAINSLASGTAQLPQIDISAPSKIIGANTIDAMKCGSVIGTAAMIEGMVSRFEEELGEKATVVLTGGLANAISKALKIEAVVDENLLLDGLKIIYNKNKK